MFRDEEYQPSKKVKISPSRRRNGDIFKVMYIFIGIFALLIGRFIYFMAMESSDVINSTYNKRQDLLAAKYVRGKILASDGTVLAETLTDSSGNETRYYPFKQLFAHVVGSFDMGKTGLELAENFTLLTSHTNIIHQAVTQMQGNKILADDMVTTLNVGLQQTAYEALGSRKGAVVALEPSTGKILAMVSTPSYDPNTVSTTWESLVADTNHTSTLLNRAAQGLYAPGSTFKVVTLLEYIKENPNDYETYQYECAGSAVFGDRSISCYNRTVHGTINLKESLTHSCNDSFANIGTLLNLKSFTKTAKKLMFNQSISFELPTNKSSFHLTSEDTANAIAQTAMGQGKTQITPLQNALMAAAIANKGKMMTPYLIEGIQTSSGHIVKQTKPVVASTSMTEEQAAILREYMEEVVNSGTAAALKTSSYQAAGKTGSAEFDSSGASHAWFIGFASKGEKEIAISVIVEDSGTGSEYAVPIAKKLFNSYLN